MSQPLLGRKALVLGVERPAGRRAAVALAEAGADVAVVTLSEETEAEFAGHSTANELWAIGRQGVVLTSDGRETAVKEAIADATAELGPLSIFVWHAPHPLDAAVLAGLRSDPAIVVLVNDDASHGEGASELVAWTRQLSERGMRANAVIASPALAASLPPAIKQHHPPQARDVASAVVYLASDESAAIEGAVVVVSEP
jgi:NAD(P)-dependent dehydrogenase (short-subunit alcohol dehydrogenase family)